MSAEFASVKSVTILSATSDCVIGPSALPVSPTEWKTICPACSMVAVLAAPALPYTYASVRIGSAAPPTGCGTASTLDSSLSL